MGIFEIAWFIIKAGIAVIILLFIWFSFAALVETLGSLRSKKLPK